MPKNKFTTISIPAPLGDKLRDFISGTGFTSMSDFVTFMLREVLSEDKPSEASLAEEKKRIKERLKALGYID